MFRPYGKDLSDFSTFPRPILLYVGRVAVEKNLREFLDIDTPGSQVVVGDGPDLASLKREYPDVHFLGALSGEKLARHYAAADLFVFPSIADTFGLVVLEACAAGLRVAAMPVPGPSDIFADDTAKDFTAMDWDLGRAVETALQLRDNSDAPRAFAHRFYMAGMYTRFLRSFAGAGSKGAPKLSALAQADCRSNPHGGGPCKSEQSPRLSNAPDMTKRGGLGPASEPTPVDCEVVSLCACRREHLRDRGWPAICAAALGGGIVEARRSRGSAMSRRWPTCSLAASARSAS